LAPNGSIKVGGAEWKRGSDVTFFEEEAAAAYAPRLVPFGLSMLSPRAAKIRLAKISER